MIKLIEVIDVCFDDYATTPEMRVHKKAQFSCQQEANNYFDSHPRPHDLDVLD